MAGPSLAGVLGRSVAGDPVIDESPALRAGRERGLVWEEARLDAFLAEPDAMDPGTWMSQRVDGAEERRVWIEVLRAAR